MTQKALLFEGDLKESEEQKKILLGELNAYMNIIWDVQSQSDCC